MQYIERRKKYPVASLKAALEKLLPQFSQDLIRLFPGAGTGNPHHLKEMFDD